LLTAEVRAVRALIIKEFRQLRRDRRTLALLFMLPVLFLIVFGYAASFDVEQVPTIAVGPSARLAAERLPATFEVRAVRPDEGRDHAERALRGGEAVVAVVAGASPGERAVLLVDGTELFAAQAALRAAGDASSARSPRGQGTVEVDVLFNPQLRTAVIMIPALCGIILVFVGTVATALGVVRERQAGTLEQLAVMPFRPRDVFLGKITPYLLIAAADMVVIVAAGVLLFSVPFKGSVATLALGATLFLFITLGTGLFISTVSQTQGQAIQLAIMTILPQFLLSGMFFPLSSMAAGVRWIGYLLPLTYFIKISRGVMVRGTPIEALSVPLLVLAVMALLVFAASTLRFSRDLAPAAPAETDERSQAPPVATAGGGEAAAGAAP
jgi:ABC-2 type transport system permease protein